MRGDVVMCSSGSPSACDRPFFSRSLSGGRSTSRNSVGSLSDHVMEDIEVFEVSKIDLSSQS